MDKTVTTLDLTGERAVRNGRLEGAKQTPPLENEDRPGQLATEHMHQGRGTATRDTKEFL